MSPPPPSAAALPTSWPGGRWGGQYLLDAVSAASVDVVSTASPRWFEYRHVGSASLEFKAGDVASSGGGGVSREPDYQSLAGAARISIETPDKTVTPFAGFSLGHDDVGRTGQPKDSWGSMDKWGLQAGGTIVMGRSDNRQPGRRRHLRAGLPGQALPLRPAVRARHVGRGAGGRLGRGGQPPPHRPAASRRPARRARPLRGDRAAGPPLRHRHLPPRPAPLPG